MHSPTYGEVTIEKVAQLIYEKIADPGREYKLVIGTDSQNFDTTKVVAVIALHCVGHGGIFFYDVQRVHRITNVGQKLLFETQVSLEYAAKLLAAMNKVRENKDFDYEKRISFCIHVDAGEMGQSSRVIPEVVGWINACGYQAVVKPDSFAASSIADRISK